MDELSMDAYVGTKVRLTLDTRVYCCMYVTGLCTRITHIKGGPAYVLEDTFWSDGDIRERMTIEKILVLDIEVLDSVTADDMYKDLLYK